MAKLRTNKKTEDVEVVVAETAKEEKATKATAKAEKEAVEVVAETAKKESIDVIDKAVATADAVAVAEVATKAPKTEPLVRICTNRDVRTYIGDQWYNLKAGKQVSVPLNVKEIFRKAGYLSAL